MALVVKSSTRKSLEAATQKYADALWSHKGDTALDYLMSRGLTKEILVSSRVGVVADPAGTHEAYKGRISFPYITPTGVVNIRFRRQGDDPGQAKFLSIAGDIARLYNVVSLKGSFDRVYICEGETDTLAAEMAGLTAVGIPGAMNWNAKVFPRVFRDLDVCVLPDNDDSGEGMKFAHKIYETLGGCDIIQMPKGMDVCKYVELEGVEALRRKVGLSG